MKDFISKIEESLLPHIKFESVCPYDPVVVHIVPKPWVILGTGNYAAVLQHPEHPTLVVKLYAPGRPGLAEEVQVYQKIGEHSAYSQCLYTAKNYLVLKYLEGSTLFDCLRKGIRIDKQVIQDIDEALEYARQKGLYPHDIHPKNVMMIRGRGYVVDVSDFYKQEQCSIWSDIKKAYFKIYLPLLYPVPLPIPKLLLESVRKGYRFYRKNMHKITGDNDKIMKIKS